MSIDLARLGRDLVSQRACAPDSQEMPSSPLTDLPVELFTHATSFIPGRSDELALRCASRDSLKAVCEAIKRQTRYIWLKRDWTDLVMIPLGEEPKATPAHSARCIEALGRVYGPGCQNFSGVGKSEVVLSAIGSFVTNTGGKLRSLSLSYCSISPSGLLDLCSACPQLNSLSITQKVPNIECADLDKLAISLNQLCPMLEAVDLPTKLTPAETYARHFPRLRCLNFNTVVLGLGHTPSRFDVIAQAVENCVHVTEIDLVCNLTPALVEMLAGTPLRDRVTKLHFSFAPFQRVSSESCIRALGAFPNLHELSIGLGDLREHRAVLTTDFCEHLASECPMLRKLGLEYINNDCMRIICQRLSLEYIAIWDDEGKLTEGLTADVVDIMLESPCATSLREAYLYGVYAFGTVELLRLVEGCPNMMDLCCSYRPRFAAYRDALNLASLRRLLQSRGGKLWDAKAAKFPTRARLTPLSDR